jgi:uncharacterized protein
MLQVTYPEIARVLERLSSSVPAAEGHGALCGALCTNAHYSLQRWLDELLPGEQHEGADDADVPVEDDEEERPLRLLFTDTLRSLRGDEMEFELLLPDDDSSLESRATALSQWCQGFLYGFGTGAEVSLEELPADVSEILRDLTHIGRATVELEPGAEEEEAAYAEVVEYVRVGVQLIHDEVQALVRDDEASGQRAGGTGPDDDDGLDDDGNDDRPDPSRLN